MKLLAAILYLHCCILLHSFGHLFPSSLRFIKEGHVSETPDVCVFDIRPLLIKSLGECALFCGLNALCNAFDYFFLTVYTLVDSAMDKQHCHPPLHNVKFSK